MGLECAQFTVNGCATLKLIAHKFSFCALKQPASSKITLVRGINVMRV